MKGDAVSSGAEAGALGRLSDEDGSRVSAAAAGAAAERREDGWLGFSTGRELAGAALEAGLGDDQNENIVGDGRGGGRRAAHRGWSEAYMVRKGCLN